MYPRCCKPTLVTLTRLPVYHSGPVHAWCVGVWGVWALWGNRELCWLIPESYSSWDMPTQHYTIVIAEKLKSHVFSKGKRMKEEVQHKSAGSVLYTLSLNSMWERKAYTRLPERLHTVTLYRHIIIYRIIN